MNGIAVHGPFVYLMPIRFTKVFRQQFSNSKVLLSKRGPFNFKCCSTKNQQSQKSHMGFSVLKKGISCDGGTIFSIVGLYLFSLHIPLSFGGLAAVATILHQHVLEPRTEALSLVGVEILELVGFFMLLKHAGKPQYKLLGIFQVSELSGERN